MTISGDFSEVHRLAADFGHAAARVLPEVDAVVKKGVGNVKDEMVADAKGSRHFKALADAITYERDYRLGQVGYVAGPDKDRRGGAIANIAYFGGANGGGGTLDLNAPLRNEEPRMLAALDRALGDLL